MNTSEIKAALPIPDYIGGQIALRPKGRNLVGLCPFHGDQYTPNFTVFEGGQKWRCFACNRGGSIFDYVGHEQYNGSWTGRGEQFTTVKRLLLDRIGAVEPSVTPQVEVTLATLAQDKGLPEYHLEFFGLRSHPDGGVAIPYLDEDGNEVAVKQRTALSAKAGSYWPKGVDLMPYGLEELPEARKQGTLILVEGESDRWTLRLFGFPVLGIPGSSSSKVLQAQHLSGISQLWVVQEPDQGGHTFVNGVSRRLEEIGYQGDVRVVVMTDAYKDPNALYRMHREDFKDRMQRLMDTAPTLEFCSQVSVEGGNKTIPGTKAPEWRKVLRPVADVLKDKVMAAEWIAEGIVPLGWLVMLAGRTKVGKTLLAIHLAYAIATGGEFLGRKCRKGAVLLILVDDPPAITHPRLEKLAGMENVFAYTGRWNEEMMPAIQQAAAELKPSLIVIDALVKLLPKRDKAENDAATTDAVMEQLATLTSEHGSTVLLIHHLGKGGDFRGSTAIESAAPMTIKAKREEGRADVELEIDWKLEPLPPLMVHLEGDSWHLLGDKQTLDATRLKDQIRVVLADPAEGWGTSAEIAEEIDGRKADVTRALKGMCDAGEATVEKAQGESGRPRKVYRMAPDFRSSDLVGAGNKTESGGANPQEAVTNA